MTYEMDRLKRGRICEVWEGWKVRREMRLITLVENSAGLRRGVMAEHGFSTYLEFGGYRLLFDAGQTYATTRNADLLGIDLAAVPVALSHGHYDHTGGLPGLLERTGPVPVYAHPEVFASRYTRRGGALRQIGIPFDSGDLEEMGARFDLSREAREISPGVWLTGEIPRAAEFEAAGEDLVVVSEEGEIVVDLIRDDQALVVVLEEGIFVILGCAHSGMISTLLHAQRVTGIERILGVAVAKMGPSGPLRSRSSPRPTAPALPQPRPWRRSFRTASFTTASGRRSSYKAG